MGDLRLEVLLNTVDKASGPMRGALAGAKGLSKGLRETQRQLKELQGAQQQLTAFRKIKTDAASSAVALRAAQQKAGQLGAELAATAAPTQKAKRAYDQARAATDKLRLAHVGNLSAVRNARAGLTAAGISAQKFGEQERSIRTRIESATKAIERQKAALGKLGAAQDRLQNSRNTAFKVGAAGAGALFAGQRAVRGLSAPVQEAIDFQSAMADVRKVVDFDTPEQFAQMGRDIQDLSTQIPLAQAELAAIVAAAGQSNVARKDLLAFARDAAQMGVAFDIAADEAGETMAKFRTAFRLGQTEVVDLTDQINFLGNTTAAGTGPITDIVRRIGALGDVAGLSPGPIAALGATVASMGVESEVGATGIKNLMLTLTAGTAATKKQRKAFGELGLDAIEMAEIMQKDAAGGIVAVLDRIRELPKAAQSATLTRLFGRESVGAIAPLLTNLDTLRDNLDKVSDRTRFGGSMLAEFVARADTAENVLQLTKNASQVAATELGKTLLPTVKDLALSFASALKWVVGFTRAHPVLAGTVFKALAALAVLVTVLGGLALAVSAVLLPFATLRFAMVQMALSGPVLAGALSAVGKALLFVGRILAIVGRAFLLNPIGLVITAIGLAVFALIKYWGPITAWASRVWGVVSEKVAAAWAGIKAIFGGAVTAIVGIVTAVFVDLPAKFVAWGGQMIDGLIQGIKAKAGAVKDAVVGTAGAVGDWFKDKLGINSPSRVFAGFGQDTLAGLADGLRAATGTPLAAMAGLVKGLKQVGAGIAVSAAAALPAAAFDSRPPIQSSGSASAAAAPSTFTVNVYGTPGMDTQALARAVRAELEAMDRERSARKRSRLGDID